MNAFAGGLWSIPLILFLGALWSFYKARKQSKSGTKHYVTTYIDGVAHREIFDTNDKFPIYKIGAFWFGIALVLGTIGSIILMLLDK